MADCTSITESAVQEAFLAAPPLIASSIIDLTIKHPNWLRDLFAVEEWPRGNGTVMEQLVFRGALPQIERGFTQWKKLTNNTGCDNPCSPDCSYNWTTFGGNGFERKLTELMRREFRSPQYCISEIQTTAHFKEVFAKIVENLYAQIDFFKEMNIGLNILSQLSKKYVVDSMGAKANTQNPYVYRPVGAARISALNVTMLEFFYEQMRRLPDCIPYDVINGSPVFSMLCSHQLLAHLYRDDVNLRQDVRFSGMANDMLMKYNFMSTVRGMFIAAPILYPRRFNLAPVTGEPIEVLPFVNGLPAEVGSYTGFNPAYEDATHEEVILHGKYPFKLFHFPTEQTLGSNTSFGPEFSMFNSWLWINPLTQQDPFRRVGYFATSAAIGISQQFSDGIFAVLVERPSRRSMAFFLPEPDCPPTPVSCDNEVPAVSCPCPIIESVSAHPVTAGRYFVRFNAPTTAEQSDTIQFGLDTGGYVTGTVVSVSTDALTVEVTLDVAPEVCTKFTTVFCGDTMGCSANVIAVSACPDTLGGPGYSLVLNRAIKAGQGDAIVGYCADGSAINLMVVAADLVRLVYTVLAQSTCGCGAPVTVCVPPETDATCPACGGPVVTQCS